jgi:hypothetical protein
MCKPDTLERIVTTNIVSANPQEVMTGLGAAMLEHMGKYHYSYMQEIVEYSRVFNGFLVMNKFELDREEMIKDVEYMRDKLCDRVMEFSPEEEEEDLDEERQEQLVAILEESRRLLTEAVLVDKDNQKFHKECGEVMELIDNLLDDIDEEEEDDEEENGDDEEGDQEEGDEEDKIIELTNKPSQVTK